MYESYWQLSSRPFENNADSRFFFRSETHQTTLLKLRYVVEQRKGAALLVGGSGFGKSFLVEMLAHDLAEAQGPLVSLVFPQMPAPELLAYLAIELGAEENTLRRESTGLDWSVRKIQHLLLHYAERGRHPLVVVDEAHLIDDPAVFQALRLLLNFQHRNQPTFTLVLVGQRDLLSSIQRLPQLDERVAVKCVLRPMSYEETLGYVTHRLQAAGAPRTLFEPAALDALFDLSGGIPRRLNNLCDLALLVGFADGLRTISVEQLEAVSEELTAAVSD